MKNIWFYHFVIIPFKFIKKIENYVIKIICQTRHAEAHKPSKKIPNHSFDSPQYFLSRTHLKNLYMQSIVELDQAVIDKAEEDDYNNCLKINEQWNVKIAAKRQERLAEEREARKLHILQRIEDKKERDAKKLSEIEQKVREIKQLAPTFITRANIDQAIEDALASIVDYNKALDPDGNWYTVKVEKKTGLKNQLRL